MQSTHIAMVLHLGLCPCICCLCQDTTPLRRDDNHCTSSPGPAPAPSPAPSSCTQPAQPSTCPVAFTLSLTDSTRARHACGTYERLQTLRGCFATALTTIAGQELDRTSDVVRSHDYSFGRMNMPFLLLLFFDDNCVARVYIRVRGSYLVQKHAQGRPKHFHATSHSALVYRLLTIAPHFGRAPTMLHSTKRNIAGNCQTARHPTVSSCTKVWHVWAVPPCVGLGSMCSACLNRLCVVFTALDVQYRIGIRGHRLQVSRFLLVLLQNQALSTARSKHPAGIRFLRYPGLAGQMISEQRTVARGCTRQAQLLLERLGAASRLQPCGSPRPPSAPAPVAPTPLTNAHGVAMCCYLGSRAAGRAIQKTRSRSLH